MNEMQVLNIHGIDCYEKDGVAYLKLEAVARGLGFIQEKNGVEYVRWETVDRYLAELGFPSKLGKGFATSGERPEYIPENIFYRLAMKAKNEAAEKFQAKVADEIIPAIRKHGGYLTPDKVEEALLNPDTIIQLATQLKEERLARAKAEKQIEADAPKVLFAGAVEASKTSILIGEYAKILKQNGVEMGQKRLFDWMRTNGWLIKRKGTDYNMPTQRAMEMGLFEIKESVHLNSSGCSVVTKTPKLTGRGQLFFTNKFLGGKKYGESAKNII